MRLLHSISATSVAVLFFLANGSVLAGDTAAAASPCASPADVDEWHVRLAAMAPAERSGQRLALAVDLAASADFELGEDGRLRYGMVFNDVAEGWSWQPQASPEREDYYRWKFLPLQSRSESRASYVQEEMVGVPQQTHVEWRYDDFFAFDNPYAFYARGEAGFAVGLARPAAVRLMALARLGEPARAESTTFWKAVHARPVDFTLRKRYLIGVLEALVVCDARSGDELARLLPGTAAQR